MLGLVDGNNFFVSCERVFDPKLAGRPVAVLSNNDGCCVSRSNEFKALGIPMGTPYFKLRPVVEKYGLVLKSSNYALYGDMSRRVMEVLREFAPEVEQYSIDEAYIYPPDQRGQDYLPYGHNLRRTILKWVGIPCGIGFAPTKTLCKIANHIGKKLPSGVFQMPQDEAGRAAVLRDTPIEDVWGVGRALAPKLQARGLKTAYDLAAADLDLLRRRHGVILERTALELRGVPCLDRQEEKPSQSITCSRSFGTKVTSLEDLRESVSAYLAQAAKKLRHEGQVAAGAMVYFQARLAWQDPRATASLQVMFPRPTDSTTAMLQAINPQLRKIYDPRQTYRKSGVILFGLESATAPVQQDLFDNDTPKKENSRLFAVLDEINAKYGKNALHTLAEGTKRTWAMKRDHLSREYTTSWQDLLEVN